VSVSVVTSQKTPVWPSCYYASGVLQLPYAEINEPFKAYCEAKKNRSRIDYYDLVQTYQIGGDGESSWGTTMKIALMTTETVMNEKHCFQVNGTSAAPVQPQTIFPDMTGFQLTGSQTRGLVECNVWQNTTTFGSKKNTYTLYQNKHSGLPLRYEMIGYDSLLGSHYDRYYIDYTDIMVQDNLPDTVFAVPDNLTCAGFPGPGVEAEHHHVTMNPMKEFCHHDESHLNPMFDQFKKTYAKNYKDHEEHATRQHAFRHNLRFINSKNRANLGYNLEVNHLADLHVDELRTVRGRKYQQGYKGYNGGLPFDASQFNVNDLPDQIDWRLFGAVTQVKDQAVCGSCWSFGTVGAVEGAYFMKNKDLIRFSQQQLVDCSWGEGNNGCDGGEDFRAYQWIMKHGLASEESYGPYIAVDGKCHTPSATAYMKGYVNVTSGDLHALRLAIAHQGPVSVAIDASHRSLSFYANGIYYEPSCGSTLDSLDHAVLAVGYGSIHGQAYWLIKNSWSTYWGNDGYVLMSQKDNNCGVATAATYVLM